MTCPNAYHGVKKLFTAQLLALIGAVCILLGASIAVIAAGAAYAGSAGGTAASGLGSVVFLAAGVILPLIAYIMNLVGLHQASKDEGSFRIAFWVSILALVLSFVNAILTTTTAGAGVGDDIAGMMQIVCEIIIFVYVLQGIKNLAERLHDNTVYDLGSKLMIMMLILYIMNFIVKLINLIVSRSPGQTSVAGVLSIVAGILGIIIYIFYLIVLGKARNMLRDR